MKGMIAVFVLSNRERLVERRFFADSDRAQAYYTDCLAKYPKDYLVIKDDDGKN